MSNIDAPASGTGGGRIQAEIERALDEERRLIAGEIHDSVNAAVLVIRLYAEAILERTAADGYVGIEKQARAIVDTANSAYNGMRRLSSRLRPELLDSLGLGSALSAFVRELDEAHPTCSFTIERLEPEPHPPAPVAMTAYRVAQEALTNAAKHAQADSIRVTVAAEPAPRHLRMTVADNGRGFDANKVASGGLGLLGMRERVTGCGGELTVESSSTGTQIIVVL